MRRLFAVSSVLFLMVLAVSPAKDFFRPYRSYQHRFAKLAASRAKSQKAVSEFERRPVAIRQIWLPEFENRVDRCTTCHLGVSEPVMERAPEPFRFHPRTVHTPDGFE